MKFFTHISNQEELKTAYRQLVLIYHPDKGGDLEQMKLLNYEYARYLKLLANTPKSLCEVQVGHIVKVNGTPSIVLEVEDDCFKARSLHTQREAYFSKSTGYALLNFKLKAFVNAC